MSKAEQSDTKLLSLLNIVDLTAGYINMTQDLKDLVPAVADQMGKNKASPITIGREADNIGPELVGQKVAIWLYEQHHGGITNDGELVRLSGTVAEVTDYDVILEGAICNGVPSMSSMKKQMDGSIIVEREKIRQVQVANNHI